MKLLHMKMSFFIISDGITFKAFGTAQDHKRVAEGDEGKNTGGMGAYSPSRLENDKLNKKIMKKIIIPTIEGLKDLDAKFKGFLYAGLMIIEDEPFLIEYNVRMGDPETEVVFPRIKNDLLDLFSSMGSTEFEDIKLRIDDRHAATIIMVSGGYPLNYEKNKINTTC